MSDFDHALREHLGSHLFLTLVSIQLISDRINDEFLLINKDYTIEIPQKAVGDTLYFYASAKSSTILSILNEEPIYTAGEIIGFSSSQIDELDEKIWQTYYEIHDHIRNSHDYDDIIEHMQNLVSELISTKAEPRRELKHVGTFKINWQFADRF